jgi:hypothetical protein
MAALVFLVLKAEAEYQAAPDAYSDARLECWVCVIQNRGRIFALASSDWSEFRDSGKT